MKHYQRTQEVVDGRGRERAENAALYVSSCTLAALTQVFLSECGNAEPLMFAADSRHPSPFEPFALLVCNAYAASQRERAMTAVKIPHGRALSATQLACRGEEE